MKERLLLNPFHPLKPKKGEKHGKTKTIHQTHTRPDVSNIFQAKPSRCMLSLLNAFIPTPNGKPITKAYSLDSSSPPDFPKGKLSIMDIKAQLESGELINIELQTSNQI